MTPDDMSPDMVMTETRERLPHMAMVALITENLESSHETDDHHLPHTEMIGKIKVFVVILTNLSLAL